MYSKEVEDMCTVNKGASHGPAPIPEEGKFVEAKEIKDISGLTHGIGWCAPQQGACKLSITMHSTHCICHTITRRSSSHIIRMKCSTSSSTTCY